jgi:hypothetical protein
MNFVISTVVVVMIIFAFFFYGAYKADRAVAEKARAMRELHPQSNQRNKKA